MAKYIMVDGALILSTPEVARWQHRANKQVPLGLPEETKEDLGVPKDNRTEYQILQDLDETPEL